MSTDTETEGKPTPEQLLFSAGARIMLSLQRPVHVLYQRGTFQADAIECELQYIKGDFTMVKTSRILNVHRSEWITITLHLAIKTDNIAGIAPNLVKK